MEQALKLLKEYSCIKIKSVDSQEDQQKLREALLLIVGLSEYENIGVCADNSQEGFAALSDYLSAFGYTANLEPATFTDSLNPVYIKYNTKKMSHYVDVYTGNYRGVLVSCQGENEAIAGIYGHFPLDLFKKNPLPKT